MPTGIHMVTVGELCIGWDDVDTMTIRRNGSEQKLSLTKSEWEWVVKLYELHDTPTVPLAPGYVPPF